MSNIKLIGIDLDGTALDSEKNISEKNRKVFSICKEKGIYIVPVTGRPYSGLFDEYKLGMKCDYSINTNGAAVMRIEDNRRIISHTMDSHTCVKVMNILKEYDCYYGMFFNGYGYLKSEQLEGELAKYKGTPLYEYVKKTRKIVNDHYDMVNKIGSCDNIYVIAKNTHIREEICKAIENVPDIYFTCSAADDVEIGGNCSKGKTLLELADMLKIKRDEVMAIGDSGNDLNMLERAGFSVAMDNASDEIKSVCDYVTKSCEESGVAYAIEKFVLKG